MSEPIIENDEGAIEQNKSSAYIPGKPFQKIARELAADDLSNSAVHKLLLNELDKLEDQVASLQSVKEDYHKLDKENAVLKEKVKKNTAFELLYTICLAVGSACIGFSKLFNFSEQGWVLVLFGGVLILTGILTKILK